MVRKNNKKKITNIHQRPVIRHVRSASTGVPMISAEEPEEQEKDREAEEVGDPPT